MYLRIIFVIVLILEWSIYDGANEYCKIVFNAPRHISITLFSVFGLVMSAINISTIL